MKAEHATEAVEKIETIIISNFGFRIFVCRAFSIACAVNIKARQFQKLHILFTAFNLHATLSYHL